MSQKSYNSKSTLYLIPTPIGNLDDITIRAIEILKKVKVIFCEDTRVTKKILNHLEIKKKLIALYEHNEEQVKEIMISYLKNGEDIALVSDSGTPIISDPGFKAVSYIIKNNFNVIGLPGATAFIPVLITSGIEPYPFLFWGFLNSKQNKRKKELEIIKKIPYTLIFYESPYRLISCLKNINNILGNRKICIGREISKIFEEIYRGKVLEVLKEITNIKGEIVIIVEGNKEIMSFDHLTIIEHVNLYIKEGLTKKEAIKEVAKERNGKKSDIYKEYFKRK